MSTAQDLLYAEPAVPAAPVLRLVPATPLDFDDAVKRVRPRLHRYAIRRLGDSHEAEELVQEALLRAYTHREQLL
ncbi:MAG: Sigma-70 region 2, partial [Frankiales bacterium]|nr:Sigma-70 region 2 [Frankiales bacterium]